MAKNKILLNLGCGSVRPDGWINTDSSLNAHIQRLPLIGKSLGKILHKVEYDNDNVVYMNLNKPWKYSGNSVDVVYASHLFEHLTLSAASLFMKEAYRCLKPGGVIRIVVPDLYQICKKYIDEYESNTFPKESTEFVMWAINMHREGQYGNPGFFKRMVYEWQGYPHQHKYMYDSKSLSSLFTSFGFINLNLGKYGESKLLNDLIKDVEGKTESYLSVYLEATKPL